MENRISTENPGIEITELTDVELQAVSGGLNPQPLPPRVAFNLVATNAVKLAAFWGF
jgi:hypothetical protein